MDPSQSHDLTSHVLYKAFTEGAYSDVTISAFEKEYKLHKLLLDRAGYFRSLFNWESSQGLESFTVEFDDENITEESFQLALRRLYGMGDFLEESSQPHNMIAVGSYLGMEDLVSLATDNIVENVLDMQNVAMYLSFAFNNNYGNSSESIIESCRGVLCCDGWQCGVEGWHDIPASIIAEIVGQDYFFVPSEWDRCLFVIKLIEKRSQDDDVSLLYDVLDKQISFCHFTPEQLHHLEELTDKEGKPYVEAIILKNALWQSISLQRRIVTSYDTPSLGLVTPSADKPEKERHNGDWYKVPIKDETITGTPTNLCRNSKSKDQQLLHWTRIPPFRFSIAFANVSSLPADKRVYAKTLWYAGSYWNLYLQKNKTERKGFQMGVYLHRASSSSSSKNGILNPDIFADNINYADLPRVAVDDVAEMKTSSSSPDTSLEHVDDETMLVSSRVEGLTLAEYDTVYDSCVSRGSFLTYEDPRTTINVYFTIYTPSRRQRTKITSFSSAPDNFNRSQSWGWKSNSMCLFNEDGSFPENHDSHLKFMVVLGNI